MVIRGNQVTECWSCNTQYSRDDTPSWPYCPNCAQPAWEVLTSAQQAKVAEAHRRLIQAWQDAQGRIHTLDEQVHQVVAERDSLRHELNTSRDQLRDVHLNSDNISYIADLEAERDYYRQNYNELRDWMSELVDERDRAVLDRNYFHTAHEEMQEKIATLTDARDRALWEHEQFHNELQQLRQELQALHEARDKALAERDHHKARLIRLHEEVIRLRQQYNDGDTMPMRTSRSTGPDGIAINPQPDPEKLLPGDRLQAFSGNWATVMTVPQQHEHFGWRVHIHLDDGGLYAELPLTFFVAAWRDKTLLWQR